MNDPNPKRWQKELTRALLPFVLTKLCELSLIGIILRWGFLIWELIFFIYCGLFVLIFVVFLCCFFFQYVSAKFHLWPSSVWFTATSDRNDESCNRIPSNYCLPSVIALRGPWRSGQRRWVSTVPGEHCQKRAVSNPTQAGQRFTWSKTWCDRQQLWKAVIIGDTVTRLIIPIRGHGKSPEEGQRWNLAETYWKKKQHKKPTKMRTKSPQ